MKHYKELIKNFKNKISKSDYTLILLIICFAVINLLIATTTYESGVFSLQLPCKTLFGSISYGVTIAFLLFYLILFSFKKIKNMKLENIYLMVAIPIGILYCIANPLGKVPDEDYQARKAMAISQGNIFSNVDENGNAIEYESTKVPELVSRTVSSYEEALYRISLTETDETIAVDYNTMALYSPICHMPQAIGIAIVRMFGGSVVAQFYGGRILNMLFSITLIYFSIKCIPFKKIVITFLGLLPITLNEFASLSADAITISSCILFISYWLFLKYGIKEKYTKTQITILGILTVIVSLVKIVYVPLVLLLILLPKEKFTSLKFKNLIIIAFIGLSFILNLCWLAYCSRFLIEFNAGVNSGEQVKYVLTHPITFLLIIFRTSVVYLQNYIVCLNGEGLSHYNAQASVAYVFSSIILFTLLFFSNFEEKENIEISIKDRLFMAIVFILIVGLIYSSIYVQWNVVSSQLIHGVQGRYFLPVLLLTALVFENKKIKYAIKNNYILIFMIFFNLNALSNICFTYISGHPIEYLIK